MPDPSLDLDPLVDLKMLPAWVNEPSPSERFADHKGEDQREQRGRDRRPRDKRGPDRKGPRREFGRPPSGDKRPDQPRQHDRRPPRDGHRSGRPAGPEMRHGKHRKDRTHRPNRAFADKPLPPIAVKFFPRAAAFDNVVEQIKSGAVAYSLFSLARLFLEKAPRHDVKLTAPEGSSLFQLGENGAISVDRHFLERNAFRFSQKDFYKIEVSETEPIKGNFTNVARDRLSGTLLGPTNHHDYQRRLRNLYEQRFSRRMNFGDYQRQIQIVTDPAEIEKWKEEARKVTTYSTSREEPPQTFVSAAEAEKHFEKNYLSGLVRTVSEAAIDGPASRQMHDRVLNKVIENEWNRETRSPSPMMQELAARFREAGLHVFRHRRGMLFVSPIFPRPFTEKQTAVSSQVRTIVDAIAASPRIGRKELADKLITDPQKSGEASATPAPSVPAADKIERAKLALASDLLWLISSGHVIEFNDGSLDLPRAKTKPREKEEPVAVAVSAAEQKENAEGAAAAVPVAPERSEGGPAAETKNATDMESMDVAPEMSAAEKEARVEAGAPAVSESNEGGPAENCRPSVPDGADSNGVSQKRPTAEEFVGSTESRPTEESEIGGS